MKISVVTFYRLGRGSAGPGEEAISIANRLYKKGSLNSVICLGHEADEGRYEVPSDLFIVPPFAIFYSAINLIFKIFNHFLTYDSRNVKEKLFDFFVSRNEKVLDSDVVIFLKPCFPETVSELNNAQKKSIAWASIFHPQFNYDQIQKEEKLYDVSDKSNYTDEDRINRLGDFYNKLDYLLVQSKLAHSIYKKYGLNEKKVILLENTFGIDCERYSPSPIQRNPDSTFKVLHISYINLIKGVGYLCSAWKKCDFENAELMLGGTIDDTVGSIIKKINPPKINLLGQIHDTVSIYQDADVFVSPSISDVNPYTILEAMACGIPVISSNMCGASEIITNGEDGFVYQYDSIHELEHILLWCYNNRSRVMEMGKKARLKSLSHQRSNFAMQIVDKIDQLVG